jgi:YVTN family beta-propeller protein
MPSKKSMNMPTARLSVSRMLERGGPAYFVTLQICRLIPTFKETSMKNNRRLATRIVLLASLVVGLILTSSRHHADTGTCGGVTTALPFNDVMSSPFFCQIAEAFFSGLTNGTSSATYSPSNPVTRDQMSAFITRTQDSALRRGSKRAALQQFWTTTPNYVISSGGLGTTTVGTHPTLVQSDGTDVWVANAVGGTVSRVRAGDGKLLDTWTGATGAFAVLTAMGRVFVAGSTGPGSLYTIDPTGAGGAVTEVTNNGLPAFPQGIAFDGRRIWTANLGASAGSVSIVTPGPLLPWSFTSVSTGFSGPFGMLFDGSNIWVTDLFVNTLLKLDQNGAILQTVNVGNRPNAPAFDGTNIWVPNRFDNTVTVVRAATGTVIATLSGNGLNSPVQVAFDGQRILVTNHDGDSVSLWKAADLTPIGVFSTGAGTQPTGACSDGTYFWITLQGPSANQLARF